MSNWITVDEIAAEYGVTGRTVRRWLAEGHLTGGHRVGPRLLRFDADEVRQQLVGA